MIKIDKVLYTGKNHTTGGRDGFSKSSDGELDIKLSPPGSTKAGTNPEQLFAAGWSACFLGAIRFVAGQAKVKVPDDATVTSTVGIGPRDDGTGFGLQVALEIKIPGLDRAQAQDLVDKAHVVCPYSHATRGNIDVKLSVA